MNLVLGSGSMASFAANDLGDGLTLFTLGGPLIFNGSLGENPEIDLIVGGNLLASVVVPEPGAALASRTMLGLATLRRRRTT